MVNKCVICNQETDDVFEIKWEQVYICHFCADAITLQNFLSLMRKKMK